MVGFFYEGRVSFGDSAFYEENKTLNKSVAYESENENGNGGEVFPFYRLSPFPETSAFLLSLDFFLEKFL